MDIVELKKSIENKSLDNSFMIWVLSDDTSEVISDQYIREICKIHNLESKYVDSYLDIQDDSFIIDNNLYIIKKETWDDSFIHDNCIVVCRKTKIKDVIKFPKLDDWQIVDYAKSKVQGIDDNTLSEWLSIYSGNYQRFLMDVSKIEIFDNSVQKFIYNGLVKDGQFSTLSKLTIWDLSNAIVKKDFKTVKDVLKSIKYIDITELGLAKVLYNSFKIVASIQFNPYIKASDLGISDKQFWVNKKYNCGYYDKNQLISILKTLTNIEYLFKYDELPLQSLIDYIVCKTLGV